MIPSRQMLISDLCTHVVPPLMCNQRRYDRRGASQAISHSLLSAKTYDVGGAWADNYCSSKANCLSCTAPVVPPLMCNALACNRGVVNKVGMTQHLQCAFPPKLFILDETLACSTDVTNSIRTTLRTQCKYVQADYYFKGL